MQDVYEAHRPLKNLMMSYQLNDTLGVVRAYSQNLAHNVPFPADIQVSRYYKDRAMGVHQWELEFIAREAIAYSQQYLITTKTLRRADSLATLLNRIRDLENQIAEWFVNQGNVWTEFHRISQRQFEWQSDMPSTHQLLRSYKIFSQSAMNEIIAEKIGLDARTIYVIGFLFTGLYLEKFALNYPPNIQLSGNYAITLEDLDAFLAHFSLPIADLRQRILDETTANMNENFAYFFNPLRMYPIIEMSVSGRRSLVAALPVLMIWRFTRGLYYELFDHRGFANAFGGAFQRYIGEVLTDLFASTSHTVLAEEPTANNRGVPSSDWFLVVGDSALVIEAKTKRMGLAAKISLNDTAQLDIELGKLADGVLQAYKCINAIQQGKFGESGYGMLASRRLYPVIVTLESWHIFGPTWQKLKDFVKQRLSKAGLPAEWTETFPFTACDISEFEYLAQAIQASDSIGAILDERLISSELERHELYTYLYHNRKSALEHARELFPNQFNNLLNKGS